jgi:hypothetical protein
VCVALGNVGNKTALPALAKAWGYKDPLIAEHARGAVEQIDAPYLSQCRLTHYGAILSSSASVKFVVRSLMVSRIAATSAGLVSTSILPNW